MNSPSARRVTLLGLALGTLFALLIAPQTRWLVRSQLAISGLRLSRQSASPLYSIGKNARRRVAAARPNDYQIQLAAASGPMGDLPEVAALRGLIPRFPAHASLYANLLRSELGREGHGVYLRRQEQNRMFGDAAQPSDKAEPQPSTTALLAFDADAAAGERLDPDNAYFPLMRAIGLFAAHRDQEGVAAVLRASKKTRWNDYLQDGQIGYWRLDEAAVGRNSALNHIAIFNSTLLPHYSQLRAVARVAVYEAMQSEKAGDVARGMAIRRALMRCGGLMRVQSQFVLGSLVGISISAVAISRPGGAPPLRFISPDSPQKLWQRRVAAFMDYARRKGYPADALRAQAEMQAGQAVRAIYSRAFDHSVASESQINRLTLLWVADLLLLSNVFWLLLLTGFSALLIRLPRIAANLPLSGAIRWGIFVGFLNAANGVVDWLLFALWSGGVVIALLLAWLFRSRERRMGWGRRVLHFALAIAYTLFVLSVIGRIALWQTASTSAFWSWQLGVMGSDGYGVDWQNFQHIQLAAAIALSVSLLLGIVICIAARVRRVPASAALIRGFRAYGVPVACVMLMAYGALVLITFHSERVMEAGIRQMTLSENRYLSALAGQPWPGPVPQ